MRVTLAQYQLLSPDEKSQVTYIDASIVDDPVARPTPWMDGDWDYELCGSIKNEEYGR